MPEAPGLRVRRRFPREGDGACRRFVTEHVDVADTPTLQHLRETAPASPPELRTDLVTPASDSPTSFALSPDGRQLVFVATGDGVSRLWVRSLATTTAQPLAGTEGALGPF